MAVYDKRVWSQIRAISVEKLMRAMRAGWVGRGTKQKRHQAIL